MCAPVSAAEIQANALSYRSARQPAIPQDPFYDVGDFWNDPRRWDGITDPTKQMFWSVDRGPAPSRGRGRLVGFATAAAAQANIKILWVSSAAS